MSKAIKIKGMSCSHCAKAVSKALEAIGGIENVKVDLDAAKATYEETQPVRLSVLKAAVEKAGYQVVE
jgi:copper chaperone